MSEVTKRQLVKWLESKKDEALKNAKQNFEKVKSQHEEELHKQLKMNETAEKIFNLISQADDLLEDWLNKIPNVDGLEVTHCYGCTSYKLHELLTLSSVKETMRKHYCDDSKKRENLNREYSMVKEGILKNYLTVIGNVQALKDAKAGVEYLKELGFDISQVIEEDNKTVSTALSTQVNISFLFIKGVE